MKDAVAVDPDIKASNLRRLRRIEGQVRGLHKMVEDGRYCADIITQVASVQEALRGVGRELMRNHLKHCAAAAINRPARAARTGVLPSWAQRRSASCNAATSMPACRIIASVPMATRS